MTADYIALVKEAGIHHTPSYRASLQESRLSKNPVIELEAIRCSSQLSSTY